MKKICFLLLTILIVSISNAQNETLMSLDVFKKAGSPSINTIPAFVSNNTKAPKGNNSARNNVVATVGTCLLWTTSTAYPIPILDQANVAIGPALYSFAGVSNGATIANSYKFDGTVWTPVAPTPQGLEYPAACTDGTNIYILGGASTAGTPLTTLYRYNVASNTYTTLAPFTTGVWNPAAVYISGKIYKFCGTGPLSASINVMEIYDIASNTWSVGAPYPQALSFVTAIAQGGFIYAAGGIASTTLIATNKAYRYDPGTNTWDDAAIADMAFQHWGATGDFYNNGFVVAGGYINGATTIGPKVEQWDQGTNTWSALPDQLTGSSRMGGAAMGGSFYVIGGRNAASPGFIGTTLNQKLTCFPPVAPNTLYRDADGDGYGDPNKPLTWAVWCDNCISVPGYVANNRDCDDSNPLIYPGAGGCPF